MVPILISVMHWAQMASTISLAFCVLLKEEAGLTSQSVAMDWLISELQRSLIAAVVTAAIS